MALKTVPIDKRSPFLGEACALCKQPFAPGDDIVICPEDATRHHAHCWRANGSKCTAYGCSGRGQIEADATILEGRRQGSTYTTTDSKVQTLPTRGFHCAQSCLLIAIAISIILFAVGCFGLWAIADYIVVEVLEWQYRAPVSSLLPNIPAELSNLATNLVFILRFA